MMVVFVFILGLFIGSFLNVVVRRLHRQESFVRGFSKCLFCGHRLFPKDLVPLFSYLYLGGRCRYCRQRFSAQYPLIELITGLVFVLIFVDVMPNFDLYAVSAMGIMQTIFWWILASFLLIVFMYDWQYYLILDKVLLPAAFVALIGNFFLGHSLLNMFLAAVVGGGFFFIQSVISRGRWIGGGDIHLGALMGLILGWPNILIALFVSYMLGSVISIILLITKIKGWHDKIPFGTFLSLATLLVMLYGQAMLAWYMGLFF